MAPSIVQVAGNSGTSTVSIGSGQGWSTPTSGNWIVIHAVGDTVLSTPSGYSLAVSGVNYSGNYIWYKQSNGTESTLSFTTGSGSARVFQAYELAGMQSSSVLDRTTSNGFGDAAISGSSGTTATTTVADEVAIAGAGGYQTFGPISVSSWSNSYTERDDRWQAPNMGATAARILTSTQTTNTTASFSNNISGGFVMIATFKGSSATNVTVTPATVTATAGVGTVTVTATSSATATSSTVASAASVGAPNVVTSTPATVTPSTVAAVASVIAPTVTATSNATTAPDTVSAVANVGTTTVQSGATATPGTVSATSSVPAPSVSVGSNATVTPATVAATAGVGPKWSDSFDYSAGDLEVVSSDWNAQGGTDETGRLLVPWVTTGSGSVEIERSLSSAAPVSSAALVDHTFGSNQSMEVDFQVPATVNESWAIEVCLRFRDDETTGYLASIYNWIDPVNGYGGVSIGYFPSGGASPSYIQWKESVTESAPYTFTPGQTYTFRAEISGSTITTWLDDVQKAQWTDPGTDQYAQFDSGRLGLIGYSENYDEAWTNFDSPQIVDVRAAGTTAVTTVESRTVTPTTVAASAAVGSATVTATSNAAAAPVAVAATAAVGAPSITAGGSATATPTTVAATASVPAPTVTATSNATATPSTVAATSTVPAPTVSAGSDVTVAPTTVAAASTVGSVTVATTSTATTTPATVAATSAVGSPVVGAEGNATIAPTTVAATVTIGAPTPGAGASVQPTAVAASAAVGPITFSSSATIAATGVAALAAVGQIVIDATGSAVILPTTVALTVTIGGSVYFAAAPADRTFAVTAQPRTITIPAEPRTEVVA